MKALLVGLIFSMSASASKLDPELKVLSDVFVVSSGCNQSNKTKHEYHIMRMPDDAPYMLVDKSAKIITRQTDKNGYTFSWNPVDRTMTVHLWADRGDCFDAPWGSTGTDSGLQIQVTVKVMRNQCPEIVEPPSTTQVKDAVTGYNNAIAAMECAVKLRKKQHDGLIQDFKAKITNSIERKGDFEKAKVIGAQSNLNSVNAVLKEYSEKVQSLSVEFKQLAREFDQDRKLTQQNRIDYLKKMLERANQSKFEELSDLIAELITYQRKASSFDSDWLMKIELLNGKINEIDQDCVDDLAEYRNWMTAEKVEKPNSFATSKQALADMTKSLEERSRLTTDKALELIKSLQLRQGALLNAMASAEARKTNHEASKLNASAQFLGQVQSEAKELSQLGKATYLYDSWTKAQAFLRFEDLCKNPKRKEWTQAGCVVALADAEKARVIIKSILPRKVRDRMIQLGNKLRNDEIEKALLKNDVREATRILDQMTGGENAS